MLKLGMTSPVQLLSSAVTYVCGFSANAHLVLQAYAALPFAYRCCCIRKETMKGWLLSVCLNTTKVGPSILLVMHLS